jgi:hypothetical protein
MRLGESLSSQALKGRTLVGSEIAMPPDQESWIKPFISISPFSYHTLDLVHNSKLSHSQELTLREWLNTYLQRDYLLIKSARHGLDLILLELAVGPTDVVTILPSIGKFYVSGCVTRTIEKRCKWSMKVEPNTRALLVIHEWGVPHPDMEGICSMGYPVIEDCAYAFASSTPKGRVGVKGEYAIYSLPKLFPVNFGGVICGLRNDVPELDGNAMSYICKCLHVSGDIAETIRRRVENWNYLKQRFESIGVDALFQLSPGLVPGVFVFVVSDTIDPEIVKQHYISHGVESSIYYGTSSVFIPCHQCLEKGSLEYLFRIYAGL